MSFLDPAIAVTLMDVAENGSKETHGQIEEAERVVELAAERARALGRTVEWRVARGEAGPEIVRAAIDGKFDAIFMSLRGVYRRGDTTAFASNTRYVLEHAPCRVILGFAPKSIPPTQPEGKAAPVIRATREPTIPARLRSPSPIRDCSVRAQPAQHRPHLRGSLPRPNSASRGRNWFQVRTVRQVAF